MIGYYEPIIKETFLFWDDKEYPVCENAVYCFLMFIDLGLRSGGGIGDVLLYPSRDGEGYSKYISRFFFDLSFFIIINIILLNIIFGIIIDSFAELRNARRFKDQDRKNRCFICNIERKKFDNEGINFEKH